MLADQINQVRRSPALALMILAGGFVLGVLIGVIFDHGSSSARAASHNPKTDRASRRDATADPNGAVSGRLRILSTATVGSNGEPRSRMQRRDALQSALEYGVNRADDLGEGGEAAAAVWIGGDPEPVVSGPVATPHRMWSMSKAVVTIAALQATQDHPEPVLRGAITSAIRRSDNCAIRRVIVGLQDYLNQGVEGAVAAFRRVLATAGAGIERTPQRAGPEQACVHYLASHQGGLPGSDLGVAAEFGTAEWTEDNAIAFAHALSEGAYGAPGAYLLGLMGLPKEPPLEEPPPPSAPPLDWGAGAAFPASWSPAWKAGWGGSQDDPPHFLAGQIVVLRLGNMRVAAAAIFVPSHEPPNDNPGITEAPEALEVIFRAARIGLEREQVGGGR
jgi:hypothetical protein